MFSEKILQILTTIGIAFLPVFEVRGAIPFALGVFKMSIVEAFCWSVLGNTLAVAIVLRFLDPVSRFLMTRSAWCNRILTALFHKTRHEHSKKFKEFGALFLIAFVAVPLPLTGGWTGSLIAYLFGVRYWPALILITIGILGAGALVSLGFQSVTSLNDWLEIW